MSNKKNNSTPKKRSKHVAFRITRKIKKSGAVQWEVYCGRRNGKRIRKYFSTKEEAESYREQAKTIKSNHGIAALAMPEELRLEAMTCMMRLHEFGGTLTQATDYYLNRVRPTANNRRFAEVAADFIETKIRANRKVNYTDGLRWSFGVFSRSFGERTLRDLTSKEIEDWVWDMDYAPSTIRGYLRDLGQLFRYSVKRHYCTENPCAVIDRPVDEDKPTIIFTPEQTAEILNAAAEHADLDLLPAFSLAFFAGLRSCEIERLDWSEIHLDRGFIEITKGKAKTRQRRIVTIQPNLEAWLRPQWRVGGAVVPANWWNRRQQLRDRIQMGEWPRNVARHSFVSHHYQAFGNENLTAAEAGHSPQMLQQHYRELVSPEDARAYWRIFPDEKASRHLDAA
jgi:integrase